MAFVTIAFWPFIWLWRRVRGKVISKRARTRRVIVVGLDGLEPTLAERFMEEGRLPNLKRLREQGSYSRLGTTLPALSPVAWSTFQTGVNPGAHNIFDFLTRDKRVCMPLLASTESVSGGKTFKLGPIKFNYGHDSVRITRKSEPFWKILGRYGVFSNVLRVPISYPPEKFEGNILSAMCTPDLKGTQGSFSLFTTNAKLLAERSTGGEFALLNRQGSLLCGAVDGPPDPSGKSKYLSCAFTLEPQLEAGYAVLRTGGLCVQLKPNVFSDWVELKFPLGRKEIPGIARFCLRELGAETTLYVSPVNVSPEKPALPISSPFLFSSWLAKRNGLYGTLGLMEDTWGRNEHALDDARFLEQTYLTHAEREKMFFDLLARTREGVAVCVFDASDRIQHMFWRYLDDRHPSPREQTPGLEHTIREMYERMDQLVGRVMAKVNPGDVLFVLSDHGFSSFRRGVNLNTWLMREGYLVLKEGKTVGADYLQDVDWSRTRAYALGLSGLYINKRGRERMGIVEEQAATALKLEIAKKLEGLKDPKDGAVSIRKVHDSALCYKGLYADEAPDLIVGYNPGYRVSWDSITGTVEAEVFSDNTKAWSGDHHVDPELIPGVLFSNRKLTAERPHIIDMAPTMLDLFAVPVPRHMEGKVLV
ncbi:MAG: alkaline phosphatase family protein [Oligoflexia bacterium]|nr:alkaline phosphatase family protein [Oligoflexia bacterium]